MKIYILNENYKQLTDLIELLTTNGFKDTKGFTSHIAMLEQETYPMLYIIDLDLEQNYIILNIIKMIQSKSSSAKIFLISSFIHVTDSDLFNDHQNIKIIEKPIDPINFIADVKDYCKIKKQE